MKFTLRDWAGEPIRTVIPESNVRLATFEESEAGFKEVFGETQFEPKAHLIHDEKHGWYLAFTDDSHGNLFVRQSRAINEQIAIGLLEVKHPRGETWEHFNSAHELAGLLEYFEPCPFGGS